MEVKLLKKFEFSLGRMLDYEQSLLDKEKNTLMQLNRQRLSIEESLEYHKQLLIKTDEQFQRKARIGTTAMELRTHDFNITSIRNQIEKLEFDQIQITHSVEIQRNIVISLSQEVSGLDKLKEKQLDEYNYSVRKAEEEIISEMISRKVSIATV